MVITRTIISKLLRKRRFYVYIVFFVALMGLTVASLFVNIDYNIVHTQKKVSFATTSRNGLALGYIECKKTAHVSWYQGWEINEYFQGGSMSLHERHFYATPMSKYFIYIGPVQQDPLCKSGYVFVVSNWFVLFLVIFLSSKIFRLISRAREEILEMNICLKCGYSLEGNRSGKCPECGLPVKET